MANTHEATEGFPAVGHHDQETTATLAEFVARIMEEERGELKRQQAQLLEMIKENATLSKTNPSKRDTLSSIFRNCDRQKPSKCPLREIRAATIRQVTQPGRTNDSGILYREKVTLDIQRNK